MAKREAVSSREPDNIVIGPPKLTRFEKARVVGARALQVSMGAPVLLDSTDASMSPIDIALLELEEGGAASTKAEAGNPPMVVASPAFNA